MVLLWHALCCKSLYTFPTLHKTHKCVTEAKQLVNHRHKALPTSHNSKAWGQDWVTTVAREL